MLERFALPCRVKETRRRGSIALRVAADEIRVLVPHGTSRAAIDRVLRQRQPWIERAIAEQRTRPVAAEPEQLWLEGRVYPLQRSTGAETRLDWLPSQFHLVSADAADVEARRQAIRAWYQRRAEREWPARVARWAARTGLQPTALKIRVYQSRWGACDARGRISLNTLLLQAPPEVLEYVIIHELCHLVHLNHSPAYWALVARWCPDYAARRRWLKSEGRRLMAL